MANLGIASSPQQYSQCVVCGVTVWLTKATVLEFKRANRKIPFDAGSAISGDHETSGGGRKRDGEKGSLLANSAVGSVQRVVYRGAGGPRYLKS